MDRGRLEAFSDGVFAVAITLLALNLAVGGPGHGPLLQQLGQHWPTFIAYLISFFTIGIIWVNHHALMTNIRVVDRTLLFLNLLLLLFVVVIPFATATMAEYLTSGGQDAHTAMALYAVPRERRRRAWLQFGVGLLVYLVATGVAFVNAPAALAIIGLVAVYYMVDPRPAAVRRAD